MNLETVTGWISIITFLSGVFVWYTGAVKKRYAAEQAFGQIREALKEISQSNQFRHEFMKKELDEIESQIAECKSIINTLLVWSCGDSISAASKRRDSNE